MIQPTSLRELLASCLHRRGITMGDAPAAVDGIAEVWQAFRDMASTDAGPLYDDGRIPSGDAGTDTLAAECSLRGREATRNFPARPPSAWLSRRVYLVDAAGDWIRSDETALRLSFHDTFSRTADPAPIVGIGGPSAAGSSGWLRDIELSPLWQELLSPDAVREIVLE